MPILGLFKRLYFGEKLWYNEKNNKINDLCTT